MATPQWNDMAPEQLVPEPGPDNPPTPAEREATVPEPGTDYPPPRLVADTTAPEGLDAEASPEYPDPHEWQLADAENSIEARQLSSNHYQLRRPDGTVEDLTAAEFDQWRQQDGGGS